MFHDSKSGKDNHIPKEAVRRLIAVDRSWRAISANVDSSLAFFDKFDDLMSILSPHKVLIAWTRLFRALEYIGNISSRVPRLSNSVRKSADV